jgi:phosphoribosylanthranilate isomerase
MLKRKVKINAVTNLTDARYFAAWEVEWMGFCLANGEEDFVAPEMVAAMIEWLDGLSFVGEFGMETAEEVMTLVKTLNLQAVQLPFLSGLDVAMSLSDVVVFKEIVMDDSFDAGFIEPILEQFAPYVDYFIFDFSKNDVALQAILKNKEFSVKLKKFCDQYSVWMFGNFSSEEWNELFEKYPAKGMCLKGGEEEKVGYKSFDELDEVFEELYIE